jgi:hypothetical protein
MSASDFPSQYVPKRKEAVYEQSINAGKGGEASGEFAGYGRVGMRSAYLLFVGFCRNFEHMLWFIPILGSLGCRSVESLPQVNLQEPGWKVRQGQAVWRMGHGTQEIAGDVVIATGPDDDSFVQFSKSPFPLVIAQSTASQWQVEFPPQRKHYAGHGTPPRRVIWLYLPRVLSGKPPPTGWVWRQDDGQWHLENSTTGESLEGYFNS